MSKDIVIKVNNIHKSFIRPESKHSSIKQLLVNFGNKNKKHYQKVLDGVDFEIRKGDFFGIVGRNGSGKSTLLKLLAGVYTPDSGSVEINGSLTPFIELGVGFNPELSGRDNVYLSASLLGYTRKQVDAMYYDIVEFAELEEHMDKKLKNYSSGMQVRLAFSISIRVESDILVLDEVLAVGDEAFQHKCNEYFKKIKEDKSKTVVLVTHSMDAVKKYCNKALLIKAGKIMAQGNPSDVANQYALENIIYDTKIEEPAQSYFDESVKNIKIKLISDKIIDEKGIIKFCVTYDVIKKINTIPAFTISDINRNIWIQNDNMWDMIVRGPGKHKVVYTCDIPKNLSDCMLKIQVAIWNDDEKMLGYIDDAACPVVILRRNDINSRRDDGLLSAILFARGKWEIEDDRREL